MDAGFRPLDVSGRAYSPRMPSRRLNARERLDVQLSGLIGRNLLTRDTAPVIPELRALARGHEGVLLTVSESCASWYGTEDTAPMCDALAALAAELRRAGSGSAR